MESLTMHCLHIATLLALLALGMAWRVWKVLIPLRIKCNTSQQQQTSSTCTLGHNKSKAAFRLMVVLGSGGHTTEMLKLIKRLDRKQYSPITFVVANTDQTSMEKTRIDWKPSEADTFVAIPRSREVGQSWISTLYTTFVASVSCLVAVYRHRPDLVLCNGPGTCVPICASALLLKFIGVLPNCRLVFCESFCRVDTLSLTGRILYGVADEFVVHWPQLQKEYPKTKYLGVIC